MALSQDELASVSERLCLVCRNRFCLQKCGRQVKSNSFINPDRSCRPLQHCLLSVHAGEAGRPVCLAETIERQIACGQRVARCDATHFGGTAYEMLMGPATGIQASFYFLLKSLHAADSLPQAVDRVPSLAARTVRQLTPVKAVATRKKKVAADGVDLLASFALARCASLPEWSPDAAL